MKNIFSILFALSCFSAYAQQIVGKVVSVADGDTVTIMDNNRTKHKIRLADIDAPESGQPYGNRAKQQLNKLVGNKEVVADCRGKDQYKRWLCTLYQGNIDVNLTMVQTGHAWVYTQYNQRSDLPAYENQARQNRLGLWSLPEADIVNPSEWRKGQNAVQQQVAERRQVQQVQSDLRCGAKKYCSQMSSCEEAVFHLQQCGLHKLDGNGDGVPCEKLCK